MLRAHATSVHWQRQPPTVCNSSSSDTKAIGVESVQIDWKRRGSAARLTATGAEFHTLNDSQQSATTTATAAGATTADKYKSNLLAKIPANSTIVGSTGAMSSNLMNKSITETLPIVDTKVTDVIGASNAQSTTTITTGTPTTPGTATTSTTKSSGSGVAGATVVKNVYNRTIDAFVLTDHCRGFLRERTLTDNKSSMAAQPIWPAWGVYCVRWRRSGDPNAVENESKFVVNGIGKYGSVMGA